MLSTANDTIWLSTLDTAPDAPDYSVSSGSYTSDLVIFIVFVKSEDVLQFELRGTSDNEN